MESNRYIARIEERSRLQRQTQIETKLCIELVWFCLVVALYIHILDNVENLDFRYHFLFIEQLSLLVFFTAWQKVLAGNVRSQTLFQTQNQLRQYTFIRSLVYFIEIVLVIWVHKAVNFYSDIVQDENSNIFITAVAFGLYAQIIFWGILVFILTFLMLLCTKRPQQQPEYLALVEELDANIGLQERS